MALHPAAWPERAKRGHHDRLADSAHLDSPHPIDEAGHAGDRPARVVTPSFAPSVDAGEDTYSSMSGVHGASQVVQRDPLTGLPHRAALLATLSASHAQAAPLGVALLGLDNFRSVNDTLAIAVAPAGRRLPRAFRRR